jgi:acyl-CoA synthetase (AMP-forming)/AMP-acid ligase II
MTVVTATSTTAVLITEGAEKERGDGRHKGVGRSRRGGPMTLVEMPLVESPFDCTGVVRGADGVKRYQSLPSSLLEMLESRVRAHPDREALVEIGGERWSYRDLWDKAARVAGGLRDRGVSPGDRVANVLPAGKDWVAGFFGSVMAGAIVVAVNTRLAPDEVAYVLEDSGAAVSLRPGEPLPDGDPFVVGSLGHDDAAALFYTSGTTGLPKGAIITQGNFLSNIENVIRATPLDRDLGPDFRALISVPLFHVTGCNSQLLATLALGGTAIVLPALNVPHLLELIGRERISWLVSVPAIFGLAIRHPDFPATDISSVRWVGYGGAPITTELVQRIAASFPNAQLSNGYGCTETSSLTSLLPDQFTAERTDSVGLPVPAVDLALDVVDETSRTGELLVRGPNVIKGYWNKPEDTARAFDGQWFRTGDIMRIDEKGFLYILDRIKDMVNRGGENVYCVEVENALAKVPGVIESAVCGVLDSIMGEKVGAVVVSEPGLTPQAVVEALKGRIADFKIPQYVVLHDGPLPRTPAGKIRKADLKNSTDWGTPLR